MNIWITMMFLQLADVLSTLTFWMLGVGEANFVVRFLIDNFGPVRGLGLKLAASLLLLLCAFVLRKKRLKIKSFIVVANYGYMVLILSNLFAILAKVASL